MGLVPNASTLWETESNFAKRFEISVVSLLIFVSIDCHKDSMHMVKAQWVNDTAMNWL